MRRDPTRLSTRRSRGVQRFKRDGFTLIEIVIVVMIIGILASAAAPSMLTSLHQARVTAAARRLKADLLLARSQAVTTNTSRQVVFFESQNRYQLVGVTDPNHANESYIVDLAESPYLVAYSSVSFGADQSVTFDQYGQANCSGSVVIQSGNQTSTVTLEASTGKAIIP